MVVAEFEAVESESDERHRGADVAAWTLRGEGRAVNWRDAGLESNLLIGPWALCALADGRAYADLLYSELAALTARST